MNGKTEKEAYDLFKALKCMVNADLYLTSMLNSKEVKGNARSMILMFRNRINVNIRELRLILDEEQRKIIDDSMLDPETTLQIDNIIDMISSLPKGIANEIEEYVESRFNVYSMNSK